MDTVCEQSLQKDPCREAREIFVRRMGDHLEAEGMPRIAGRLFGLMILEPGLISFGELAERLEVSRGSISTNARLLERKGLIVRVRPEGERQEYFRLAEAPYANMLRSVAARMEQTRATIVDALSLLPDQARQEHGRLAEADCFFRRTISALEALAADIDAMAATPTEGFHS